MNRPHDSHKAEILSQHNTPNVHFSDSVTLRFYNPQFPYFFPYYIKELKIRFRLKQIWLLDQSRIWCRQVTEGADAVWVPPVVSVATGVEQ